MASCTVSGIAPRNRVPSLPLPSPDSLLLLVFPPCLPPSPWTQWPSQVYRTIVAGNLLSHSMAATP
eukprot:12936734-Prorocentrum_lima.AAC.1